VALNPRHRVPVLVDGDFVLYESIAITEYLEDAYPGRGAPLFPGDAQQRAVVRRMIAETDDYLSTALDPISVQAFERKPDERDAAALATATDVLRAEYAQWSRYLRGDFLVGPLSAADFSLYPRVAVLKRYALRLPGFDGDTLLTPELLAWRSRMQALPYLDKTVPPHWKAP
jgi:glutathione S-transferase